MAEEKNIRKLNQHVDAFISFMKKRHGPGFHDLPIPVFKRSMADFFRQHPEVFLLRENPSDLEGVPIAVTKRDKAILLKDSSKVNAVPMLYSYQAFVERLMPELLISKLKSKGLLKGKQIESAFRKFISIDAPREKAEGAFEFLRNKLSDEKMSDLFQQASDHIASLGEKHAMFLGLNKLN